jgi:hypothetical protein
MFQNDILPIYLHLVGILLHELSGWSPKPVLVISAEQFGNNSTCPDISNIPSQAIWTYSQAEAHAPRTVKAKNKIG